MHILHLSPCIAYGNEVLKLARAASGDGLCEAEIDTSASFESVKEAATRFGGMALSRPISPKNASELTVDIVEVEEQAAQMERELITKERETLGVLKELDTTKVIIEELKLKLQKEVLQIMVA
ncbi:hypothetical protein F511_31728 [Dorcoceras hygrometricum]|uniref:Uncharacterized protein n=1 Tax=Dorcoceras hygrometricum TaxID=472368 RepID=A0A2Z7AIF7_9LAMI|nr:hypothetical protein F511_31728 [Dorcoceras hygrometricum]